jgi:hypothetical protein
MLDRSKSPGPAATASAALTLQFLAWVADGERRYGDVMEAWRSTCPRMSIWEDAVRDGLVRIENSGAMKASRVVLTERGKSRLKESRLKFHTG